MLEAIFALIGVVIGAVIGSTINYIFEKRRDKERYNRETEQRRIDILRSHMSDFFSPLITHLSRIRFQIRDLWDDPNGKVILKETDVQPILQSLTELNEFVSGKQAELSLFLPQDLAIIIRYLEERFTENLQDKIEKKKEISVEKILIPLQLDYTNLIGDIQRILGVNFPRNLELDSNLDEFMPILPEESQGSKQP